MRSSTSSIDGVSTHALGADLVEIRRAIDRLEAEFVRRLHRFDRGHGAAAEGGVSTVSWLRSRCGMTVKAAAYRVHLARTLGELPATLDSARAGRASFGNVATRTVGEVTDHDAKGSVRISTVTGSRVYLTNGPERTVSMTSNAFSG